MKSLLAVFLLVFSYQSETFALSCDTVANTIGREYSVATTFFGGTRAAKRACRNNPAGNSLYPSSSDPEQVDAKKMEMYCELNPQFRACFVCENITNGGDKYRSFSQCNEFIKTEERELLGDRWLDSLFER